jgi:MraZ protein
MFYGEYKHTLDTKGRIILPSRFRDVARENNLDRFFVTRGLEKCVFMFAENEWRTMEQKFKALPFTKEQSRSFNRMFFAGAAEVIPDKQGRFIIPQNLKEHASITGATVIIGVSNRIEIWDQTAWQEFFSKKSQSFEETAEHLFDL